MNGERRQFTIRRILVALDGSPHSQAALDAAARLARPPDRPCPVPARSCTHTMHLAWRNPKRIKKHAEILTLSLLHETTHASSIYI